MPDGRKPFKRDGNPFTPIDARQRFTEPPRDGPQHPMPMMQPGQLYGGHFSKDGKTGNAVYTPPYAEPIAPSDVPYAGMPYDGGSYDSGSFDRVSPVPADVPGRARTEAARTAPGPTIAAPARTEAYGARTAPGQTVAAPARAVAAHPIPEPAPAHRTELPSYLKKRPPLHPATPPPDRAAPPVSATVSSQGVRVVSTFPPVRDEIDAFFHPPEEATSAPFDTAEFAPPDPAAADDFSAPAHSGPAYRIQGRQDLSSWASQYDDTDSLPESAEFPLPEGDGRAYPSMPDQGFYRQSVEYETDILPESAEVPVPEEGDPTYHPLMYEIFPPVQDPPGEWETPPPAPAYVPTEAATPPWRQNEWNTTGRDAPIIKQTFPPSPGTEAPDTARNQPSNGAPAREPQRVASPSSKRPTPAAAPEKPPKKPVPWGKMAAIVACAAMLIFCVVVGGRLLYRMEMNAKEVRETREKYRQNGGSLNAARVDLPPTGQTLAPSATTPSNPQGASLVQSARELEASASAAAPVESPAPRSRQSRYPDNSLRNVLDSMSAVVKEYPDVVGRLYIPGVLDEMVVYRDNTYYLSRNYRGASSDGGAVFMDEKCSLLTPPENLLLRGRGDVPGTCFAPLWQYRDGGESFVRQAYTATLTTLYEEESYVLLAVVVADSDPSAANPFDYSGKQTFATDDAMLAYVRAAMSRSLYRFSTDVQPSDRLLTLATVSAGGNGQSVVLLFRMKRKGE